MPERPTDPSWIDGYREGVNDAKNVVEVWAACTRAEAQKISGVMRAVMEEQAAQMERLLSAFDTLAAMPHRALDFDDEDTKPGQ